MKGFAPRKTRDSLSTCSIIHACCIKQCMKWCSPYGDADTHLAYALYTTEVLYLCLDVWGFSTKCIGFQKVYTFRASAVFGGFGRLIPWICNKAGELIPYNPKRGPDWHTHLYNDYQERRQPHLIKDALLNKNG